MPTHPNPIPRGRTLAAAFAALFGLVSVATAGDWHLSVSQSDPQNWNQVSHWNTNAAGSGAAATAMYPADNYHTNGKTLRSPVQSAATTSVFPGGVLTVNGGGRLLIKAANNGGISAPRIVATGGSIEHFLGGSGLQFVQTPIFENRSGSTTLAAATGSTTLRLDAGSMLGAGDTRITGAATSVVALNVGEATTYLGTIDAASGTLRFDTDLSSAGTLLVGSGAKIALNNRHLTFTGLTVNGTVWPIGTHTYADLSAAHAAQFPAGGAGSITVRPVRTWYLSTSQTSGADWTTTPHWKPNADGSGASATSINGYDIYANQVASRVLRTPSSGGTFPGGTLSLRAGAQLLLAHGAGQTATVPLLDTAGAVTITHGSSGTRGLTITKWLAGTGTTTFSTVSGGVTELRLPEWVGAGNLTVSGTGQLRPFIGHSKAHTGTITVNSGATLAIQAGSPFSTGGKLVVNSGGLVSLDDWIYCTALTVNGVVKPLGSYSATELGSGFSGVGKVVVYTPDTVGRPLMFGVNVAGADFPSGSLWQTDPVVWDYYQSKGLTLVRLPFKWNSIQSSIAGAKVDFSKLDVCVQNARERGMKVILDVHSYGSYSGSKPWLGDPSQPLSRLIDLWEQIAEHYKDEEAVIGYDLMNEPNVAPGTTPAEKVAVWAEMAQQLVHRIRRIDQKHYIYVEGLYASAARNWHPGSPNNASLDIKDPVGRLIYSAHCYADGDNNGVYTTSDVPHREIIVNYAKPFVEWLRDRPYAQGHIGEFGVPKSVHEAGWKEALERFIEYLRDNNISGTYWAGGESWTNYDLSAHPAPFPGPDQPQMTVLEKFPNSSGPTNVFVDNQLSGTLVTFLPSVAAWSPASSAVTPRYHGDDYQHDGQAPAGTKSVKFTPNIPAAGNYDVFVRWTTHENRAHGIPVTVVHAGGSSSAGPLDQRKVQDNAENGWNPIGTYAFNKGTGGSVTLSSTGNGTLIADAVWFRPSLTLPAPWQAADVGSLAIPGTSSHSGGVYTLASAGTIFGTADAFHFVHRDVVGDCTLTARVYSQSRTNAYARAGVMIRDGLGASAVFADAIVTPDAIAYLQSRTTAGGTVTTTSGGTGGAPYWVRVQRVGNTFRAYKSASGAPGSWTQMGQDRIITMGASAKVGLVACSYTTNTQSTVVFDNVTLTTP